MLKRHFSVGLASVAVGLGLLGAGCGNNKTTGGGGGGTGTTSSAAPVTHNYTVHPATGTPINLAFVTNNPSDYWVICRKGTEAAEKALPDVKVQFVMPADGTAATQRQNVDELLAKGIKGIAISPVDPANETSYLNQVAAQTNVITSDSDAPDSNRLCYIGTDNEKAGEMAGGLIKEALPQGGKIMIFVGKSDAQNAMDRINGVRKALAGSNIQVLDVRTDDADHARAKANAADALVKNPDLACLVGIWSYNGPAIYSAVQDASKIGKVKIVAFDQEDQTIAGIRAGAIYATVVQDPYTFGYNSIQLLEKLAKNDTSGVPANRLSIVPTQAIKKDNVDKYMAEYNKKLGKA